MSKRATLKQVAEAAGVSYQTVSKVLNKKVQVRQATEARILKAARELGYRPNLAARNLRTQRSGLIGCALAFPPDDQLNPILERFLESMTAAAILAGYHLLGFPHRVGEAELNGYQDLIDTQRVDGFVLTNIEYNDPRIPFLKQHHYPFVAFGRSNPDWYFPYVDIDVADGMRQLMRHILERGHRRIALLALPESSRMGQNRLDGCLEILGEAGLPHSQDWIMRGDGNYSFGLESATQLLSRPVDQRPTAILAFNDVVALGAMRAAESMGITVGEDLAITGFDNLPIDQFLKPALTSVSHPVGEAGQQVIEILVQLLDGSSPQVEQRLLKPELHIRASSSQRCPES